MKGVVLIVEDADDTRELLAELLMREGYHSIMACTGQEALHRLDEVRVDVIVTDLAMPEMSGAELAGHLGRRAELKNVPIILLTASGADRAAAALEQAGGKAARVMTKPVHLGNLLDAIALLTKRVSTEAAPA